MWQEKKKTLTLKLQKGMRSKKQLSLKIINSQAILKVLEKLRCKSSEINSEFMVSI